MTTIVTRAGKGSALTWNEVDANFTGLDGADLAEASARAAADAAETAARTTAVSAEASARATADALLLTKANNLSDVANAGTARTNLGLGSIATQSAASVAVTGGAITGTTIDGVSIKTYVDNLVAGLKWKQTVVAATTASGTLASSFANGSVIDGVTLATGDRILIKDQSTGSQNGIYIVAASGAPTRATDADSGTELVSAAVIVEQGTVNADSAFVCTNNAITLGSTSLVFTQFGAGASGALIAANNLSDLGNAGTARTNLGLGSSATHGAGDFAAVASNLSDLTSASTARSNLGLSAVAASGSASDLASGTLPAARLPNPSSSSLGGVQSVAAQSHKWVDSISTGGVPNLSQPAAADVSGLAASATTDATNASNISSGTLAGARGGGLVLLEQHTASASASLDFTSCFSGTYDEYQFEIINAIPAAGTPNLVMLVSTDGSTYLTTGYTGGLLYVNHAGSSGTNSGVTTNIRLNENYADTTTASGGVCGSVKMFAPGSTTVKKMVTFKTININGSDGSLYMSDGGGWNNTTSALLAVRFKFQDAGGTDRNMASGIIRCFGIAKS